MIENQPPLKVASYCQSFAVSFDKGNIPYWSDCKPCFGFALSPAGVYLLKLVTCYSFPSNYLWVKSFGQEAKLVATFYPSKQKCFGLFFALISSLWCTDLMRLLARLFNPTISQCYASPGYSYKAHQQWGKFRNRRKKVEKSLTASCFWQTQVN